MKSNRALKMTLRNHIVTDLTVILLSYLSFAENLHDYDRCMS